MSERPETFSILVVCDGNVCRSACAEYLLGERLPYISVRSAGAHARAGMSLCTEVARTVLASDDHAQRFRNSFRSRTLAEVDLAQFQLVLAATGDLRGELSRSAPALRDSFFTIREAASIVTSASFAALFEPGAALADLPSVMNLSRGIVPRPVAHRRRQFGATTDIPDGHHSSAKRHSAAIDEVVRASKSIATAFEALVPSHG